MVGRHVAPTTEHNRLSIVWVCQASNDIQLHYITLIGGVIQLAFFKVVDFSLYVNEKIFMINIIKKTTELLVMLKEFLKNPVISLRINHAW